ncbi:hypothetical protein N7447_009697 [Penicillium robsamsonii]|uniref:uncharacterized protein n=1 Tax=Penicillium robsamsonii TaxID=1792511 RepID=UPI002547DCD3|nr:uncharacterized protein N7447_009697 [Penicillium robsamsonii]KAJ5817464.1 hypothetical protein N7447_009697 [Penicillium robsamsonii]
MTIPTHPQLGWIGKWLGNMGSAMASNLQNYLHAQGQLPLRFWNRTACKGEALTSLGGVYCDSIADVVRDSAIIFISTSNDEALQTIITQIISAGNLTDKIIVDTTTVHPDTSKAVSAKLTQENAFLVSGPVFGSAPMAAERKILMVAAGSHCPIHRISPYIKDVIARDMLEVGDRPEKASLLKIIGNFLVSGLTEIIGEAQVLAEKSDLGTEVVEKLLEAQFGPLPTMISKRLTQGVYMPPKGTSPWSNLDLALKDVDHAIECGAAVGTRLPVGEVVLDHLKRAKVFSQEQDRQMDSAASYGIIRCDAGLEFENEFVKKRDA